MSDFLDINLVPGFYIASIKTTLFSRLGKQLIFTYTSPCYSSTQPHEKGCSMELITRMPSKR